MTPNFQQMMNKAALLTRSGNLQAATAAIQAALSGAAAPAAAHQMKPAHEVIDVAAREVPNAEASGTPGDVPRTARFVTGSHQGAAGQRDFKLYIPAAAGGQPLPLVVMLHGCTQNPDDFAAGTAMNELAAAHGFFVLYPAQSQQANPQRCWNWFKHNHQARGRGEPALLAGMTREVMAAHAIDPARVYVAGLSAGGAMAAILGDAYPELYAAVGVHSGLATGIATDLPSALGAMKSGRPLRTPAAPSGVPTIVFHGDGDTTVRPANAAQIIAASAGTGTKVSTEQLQTPGGRTATRSVHHAPDGSVLAEHWRVHGAPHAWSGGSARGSYTDARGPDASAEMLRFFMAHPRPPAH